MNGTRLTRSPDDRVLAGVAGGMAESYGWDPALVRIIWVLLALLTGGVMLILYIVMALVVPLRDPGMPPAAGAWASVPPPPPTGPPGAPATGTGEPAAEGGTDAGADTSTAAVPGGAQSASWQGWQDQRRARRQPDLSAGLLLGGLLILVGVFFLAREFFPLFQIGRFWPLLVIGAGLLLIIGAFARRGR